MTEQLPKRHLSDKNVQIQASENRVPIPLKDLVVLYVEDDRSSRKVIEVLLTMVMGIQKLTVFENSENFLEKVTSLPEKPNLIFLDIQIKPLSGYEMLNLLRSQSEYVNKTIIALTANVMAHDVEQLKSAGFDGLTWQTHFGRSLSTID